MARKERVPPCAGRESPLEKAGLRSAQKIFMVSSQLDARAIPSRKIGASQRTGGEVSSHHKLLASED